MTVILSNTNSSSALIFCLITYLQAFSLNTKSTNFYRYWKTNSAPIINNNSVRNIWILCAPVKKKVVFLSFFDNLTRILYIVYYK